MTAAVSVAYESEPLTLAEEHALLVQQIAVRAEDVLASSAAGRWPERELGALVGYLRDELLRHAADEEWLLFPGEVAGTGFARLGRDHVRLRELTDALAAAMAHRIDDGLDRVVRELVGVLECHVLSEERLLRDRAATRIPATTDLRRGSGEWYPLIEGPSIDLDLLPNHRAVGLAVDRLLRLRPHEQVELRSSSTPYLIWQRMDRVDPGGYGFTYLREGPDLWIVRVTRRAR